MAAMKNPNDHAEPTKVERLQKQNKKTLEKSVLSLKEKQQHTIALPTYKLPARTYMFYDRPVKYRIIFVDFGI